jgi:hypothetical protein
VLLHTVWLAVGFTVGVGFTVIVNVCTVPVQPAAAGVMVTIPEIGTIPVFAAVNEAIFPVPDAPRPIAVLLLVQL